MSPKRWSLLYSVASQSEPLPGRGDSFLEASFSSSFRPLTYFFYTLDIRSLHSLLPRSIYRLLHLSILSWMHTFVQEGNVMRLYQFCRRSLSTSLASISMVWRRNLSVGTSLLIIPLFEINCVYASQVPNSKK